MIFKINSISLFHDIFSTTKATHPLITKIKFKDLKDNLTSDFSFYFSDLYMISLIYSKEFPKDNELSSEENKAASGQLSFSAPGHCIFPHRFSRRYNTSLDGWILCFHPTLIKDSQLTLKIQNFDFLKSNHQTTLTLSEGELSTFSRFMDTLSNESQENIDFYSKELLVSHLEVILNYCRRYYGNISA